MPMGLGGQREPAGVFPAQVGMNRRDARSLNAVVRVPRTRETVRRLTEGHPSHYILLS